MAKRFKMLGSVSKSYEQQGIIFFTCRTFDRQPERVKQKIRKICQEAAGENADALFEFLTTEEDWVTVTMKYYISGATLERARTRFYNFW